MNEMEIKAESGKEAARNMAGMTDKDAMEYVTVNRSWGCLVAAACLSLFAGLGAGWIVWTVCKGCNAAADGTVPSALSQAPYSVCPFCGSVLDGRRGQCVPEGEGKSLEKKSLGVGVDRSQKTEGRSQKTEGIGSKTEGVR